LPVDRQSGDVDFTLLDFVLRTGTQDVQPEKSATRLHARPTCLYEPPPASRPGPATTTRQRSKSCAASGDQATRQAYGPALHHDYQRAASSGGGWSGWTSLGGGLAFKVGYPQPYLLSDGRIAVDVWGTDNVGHRIYQLKTGGCSGWVWPSDGN
jgi:hypothetical protein